MKKLLSLILAATLALSLVSCSSNETTTSQTTSNEEINTSEMKIISFSPSVTEVLSDLGIEEELVAVDLYVGEGYENLPAFDAFTPDIEAILELEPNLIFVSSMTDFTGKDLYSPLIDAGIEVISIPISSSIEAIYTDIQTIANTVNKSSEGETLIAEMKATIEEISAIGQTITDKKTVYFETSSLYPATSGTYLHEMIEIIGAENVFADQEGWIATTQEEVIARNPDVFLTSDGYTPDVVNSILNTEVYSEITAIMNNDVYFINANAAARPNHNIVIALEEMAVAVYGEIYQ